LTPWKVSVIQCDDVVTSIEGEVAPGQGGDDDSWTDGNLTGTQNEENSRD
jgi:hypothetical protein